MFVASNVTEQLVERGYILRTKDWGIVLLILTPFFLIIEEGAAFTITAWLIFALYMKRDRERLKDFYFRQMIEQMMTQEDKQRRADEFARKVMEEQEKE